MLLYLYMERMLSKSYQSKKASTWYNNHNELQIYEIGDQDLDSTQYTD